MQLDATCGDLDFEVMKFIRMPWSPHTPPQVFNLAIRGHIVANHALFGKLPVSDVATDFDRLNGEWHVKDFTAKSLDGLVKLNLSGLSGPDNHIHIQGRIKGMDARALCLLMGQATPALVGRLSVTADLLANTDVDFFGSLSGTAAVEVLKRDAQSLCAGDAHSELRLFVEWLDRASPTERLRNSLRGF